MAFPKNPTPLIFAAFLLLLVQSSAIAGFIKVNENGFGTSDNRTVQAMGTFNSGLYAGTYNWMTGSQIWTTTNGHSWSIVQQASNGFGNPANDQVMSFSAFQGRIYAGTRNNGGGTELWRSLNGVVWAPANLPGFGDPANIEVCLFSNKGLLFAGTTRNIDGGRIYVSDQGAPASWKLISASSNGFGDPNNRGITAFASFNGFIYASAWNSMTGSEIHRSADATNWKIVPSTTNAFGVYPVWPYSQHIDTLQVFSNRLYAGCDDGEVWRTSDGTNWMNVRPSSGFGIQPVYQLTVRGPLLWLATRNTFAGRGELLESASGDPASWITVNDDGWGDMNNSDNLSLAVFKNGLFAGNQNWGPGAAIYSDLKFDYLTLSDTSVSADQFVAAGATNITALAFDFSDFYGHPLTGLSVRNLGAMSNNRDVTNLRLWYDVDGNRRWSSPDVPASGPAVYSNAAKLWQFNGLSIRPATNLILTVNIARTAATNSSFKPLIPGRIDYGRAVCSNLGSNIADLSNMFVIVVGPHLYTLLKTADNPSMGIGYPGSHGVFSFRISDSAGHDFTVLELTNLGTMTASTDISSLNFYYDVDSNGVFSSSTDQWAGWFNYSAAENKWIYKASPPWPLPLPSNTNYVAVFTPSQAGVPGRTFEAAVNLGDIRWSCGAFNTAQVFNAGILTRVDDVIPNKLADLPQTNVMAGTANLTSLFFDYSSFYFNTNYYKLSSVRVTNVGSAVQGLDITTVRIWRDASAPFGRYNAGDFFVSTGTYNTAGNYWQFSGSFYPGTNYLVVFDIPATARSNRTVRMSIPAAGLTTLYGVPSHAAITNKWPVVIRNTNHVVTVTTNHLYAGTAYTVSSNKTDKEVLAFHFQDTKSTHVLRRLAVINLSNMQNGSDIAVVRVWNDAATVGKFDFGLDSAAGILSWDPVGLAWTNNSLSIPEGGDVLVTIDTAPTLNVLRKFRAATRSTNSIMCSSGKSANRCITNDDILTVDLVPPDAVAAVHQPFASDNKGLLSWHGVTNLDLDRYRVAFDTNSHAQWVGYAWHSNSSPTNVLLTGLSAGRTYYFRVRAIDRTGNTGDPSAEFSFQTFNRFNRQFYRMNADGFGFGNSSTSVGGQVVFAGKLYAAADNWAGAKLFSSSGGVSWSQVNPDGFGDMNNREIRALAGFNGLLVAGTYGMGASGPEVWVSPDGSAWTRTVDGGVGDISQRGVLSMASFKAGLYAGCEYNFGFPQGADLWSTSNATNWSRPAAKGFGDPNNQSLSALCAFKGFLYAGTKNSMAGSGVYASPDGSAWGPVLPAMAGFGNNFNTAISALCVFSNRLVAGTENFSGAELWWSPNGTNWLRSVPAGFLDQNNQRISTLCVYSNQLWVFFQNWSGGVQIYRTGNMTNWERYSADGLGDVNNQDIASAAIFKNGLFLGTKNWNGCQEWSDLANSVSVLKVSDVPARSGLPGSVNNTVMNFTVRDSYLGDFSSLLVRNLGSMTTNDIAGLNLWYDTDKNGRYSAADQPAGFPAVWNPAVQGYEFILLSTHTFTNLIMTADLKPQAVFNRTFIGSIRTNAVTGFDGFRNTATAVTNNGALFVGAALLYYPAFTILSNLKPSFRWSFDASVDTNTIQISTNNFAAVRIGASLNATNYAPVVNMRQGTNWWRVRVHLASSTNWYQSYTAWFVVDRTPPAASLLVSPASNSWSTNSAPRLIWRKSSDAYGLSGYEVVLSTNAGFSSYFYGFVPSPTTNVLSPALADGLWYWKIRPMDAAGNVAAWSPAWRLRVDTADPAAPSLALPLNNAFTNANPVFLWNKSLDLFSGISNYRIEISSNAGFAPVNTVVDTSSTQYQRPSVPADGTWWWRVRAADRAGHQSAWSVVRQLVVDTVVPPVPVMILPSTGKITNDNSPSFLWTQSPDAGGIKKYEIRINNTVYNAGLLTNWTYGPGICVDGTSNWQVRAVDNANNISAWSPVRSLAVDSAPPPAPVLILALNGSFTNDSTPVFLWKHVDDSSGIAKYEIGINSTVYDAGSATNWTYGPGVCVDGTSNWRVRAVDGAGNIGAWSAVRSLSVDTSAPLAVNPVNPLNNALTNDNTPVFVWNGLSDPAGIGQYQVQVNATIYNVGLVTNWSYPSAMADGVSNWRVRAVDLAHNPGAWSAVRSIRIDQTAPSSPVSILPLFGVWTNDPTPGFSWAASSDANGIRRYEVAVNSTVYDALALTNWTYPSVWVDGSSNWQVRAVDNAGNISPWNAVRSLKVDAAPPPAPALIQPFNTAVTNDKYPDFKWAKAADFSGVKRYEIRIGTTVYDASTLTNWTYGPGVWVDGTSNWSVRAVDNADNIGPWSLTRSLSVDTTPPSGVVLSSPSSNSTVSSLVVDFIWTASADAISGTAGYIVQVDDNKAFSSPSVKVTNSIAWRTGGFANNSTNWWRIRAFDNKRNTNAWSSAWSVMFDTNQIVPVLYSPPVAAVTNNPDPVYLWSFNSGVSRYQVEVRTNNISGKVVVSNTNISATNANLAALNDGRYFWRVRAFKTSTLKWQTWSGGNAFNVDTAGPPAVGLVLPANAELTNDNTPSFVWNRVGDPSGIKRYEIRINNSVFNAGVLTNWTYGPGVCVDGTSNWQVRAVDNAGNAGAWSGVRPLTVDTVSPSVPAQVLPLNAEVTNDSTPFFLWNHSTDANGISRYDIRINNTVYDAGSSTNWTYGPGICVDGTSNWSVRAVDSAGNPGAWTGSRSLVVYTAIPSAPVPVSPPNGKVTKNDQPLFVWNSVSQAVPIARYEIQVGTTIHNAGASTNWSYNPGNMAEGTSNWRVRAVDTGGNTGSWSAASSLTIDLLPPSDPSPVSPANTALTNDQTPTFLWSRASDANGILRYEVRINGQTIYDAGAATNWTYGPGVCVDGTTNWDVRSVDNASNTGNWVSGWTFTVHTVPPAVPLASFPPDMASTNDSTPSFSWLASADSVGIRRYEIRINNSVFNAGLLTGWTYGPGIYVDGTSNWQVRAVDNAANASVWSPARLLTVDTAPPSVPALQSPVDASLSASADVNFTWFASVDALSAVSAYRVEVDDNPAFSSPLTRTTNSLSCLITGFLNDSTNYWRVRAVDSRGNSSAWSAVWSVRIDTNQIIPVLISPANAVTTNFNDPVYGWSSSAAAGRYWIEVRTNYVSGKVVASNTNVAAASAVLSGLNDGKYAWRVKAWKTAAAQWQVWSGAYSLVIDTIPPATVAIEGPPDGAFTNDNTPAFSWSGSSDLNAIKGYEIEFNGSVRSAGAATNWVYGPGVCVDGVSNWRVRAVDSAGNRSVWSGIASLAIDTLPPGPAPLLSPANAVFINSGIPVFTWNSAADLSGVKRYEVRINSSVYDASTATNWIYPGIMAEGFSNWSVRAVDNADNAGPWSAAWSFFIDTSMPAAPVLHAPVDSAITSLVSPVFTWAPSSDPAGIAGYEVMVGVSIYTAFSTNWTYTGTFGNGTTNLWRVRALDNGGNTGAWSVTRSLVVDTAVSVPVVISPAAWFATNDTTPDFRWRPVSDVSGILRYEVKINNSVFNAGGLTNWTYGPGICADGTSNWSVRAVDNQGNSSAWSASRPLIVDTVAPAAPSLVSPLSNVLLAVGSPDLVWTAALDSGSGIARYRVQIGSNDFGVIYRTVLTSSNQTNRAVFPVLPAGTWFWRVCAVDRAGNQGPFSGSWSFTVPVVPEVMDDLTEVRLYPNPVFQGETLRIDRLTKNAKIEIYSLTGIKVFPKDGSTFEISDYTGGAVDLWTPSDEASGVYLVAVWNSVNTTVVRKIVLIKAPRE